MTNKYKKVILAAFGFALLILLGNFISAHYEYESDTSYLYQNKIYHETHSYQNKNVYAESKEGFKRFCNSKGYDAPNIYYRKFSSCKRANGDNIEYRTAIYDKDYGWKFLENKGESSDTKPIQLNSKGISKGTDRNNFIDFCSSRGYRIDYFYNERDINGCKRVIGDSIEYKMVIYDKQYGWKFIEYNRRRGVFF